MSEWGRSLPSQPLSLSLGRDVWGCFFFFSEGCDEQYFLSHMLFQVLLFSETCEIMSRHLRPRSQCTPNSRWEWLMPRCELGFCTDNRAPEPRISCYDIRADPKIDQAAPGFDWTFGEIPLDNGHFGHEFTHVQTHPNILICSLIDHHHTKQWPLRKAKGAPSVRGTSSRKCRGMYKSRIQDMNIETK